MCPGVRSVGFDVLDISNHGAFLDSLGELPDTIVCVIGSMGDQAVSERDVAAAELVMRTNYVGPAALFSEAANRMAMRGTGTLIGISSVAGERGRARNYIYGSAKAGFTAFLSGLRQRLAQAGTSVRVVTVLPGFVRTSAIAGMATPGMLTAEPKQVADAILRVEVWWSGNHLCPADMAAGDGSNSCVRPNQSSRSCAFRNL